MIWAENEGGRILPRFVQSMISTETLVPVRWA